MNAVYLGFSALLGCLSVLNVLMILNYDGGPLNVAAAIFSGIVAVVFVGMAVAS